LKHDVEIVIRKERMKDAYFAGVAFRFRRSSVLVVHRMRTVSLIPIKSGSLIAAHQSAATVGMDGQSGRRFFGDFRSALGGTT
jgi:hypothetical protein